MADIVGDDIRQDWPFEKGLLDEPVSIAEGRIEIIRPFNSMYLAAALFDFDGNISTERDGWPNLMVQNNLAYLLAFCPDIPIDEAHKMVLEDIELTIGIPTYMQMKRLAQMISANEGPELDPAILKRSYVACLNAMVDERQKDASSVEDYKVPNANALLSSIQGNVRQGCYLASGTDVDSIRKSVERLGYQEFFPVEKIVAAGSLGPEDCAKKFVIGKLLSDNTINGGNQLLTLGDGFPEILHTYLAGGVAVGVITPDHSDYEHLGYFTVEKKRQRLMDAGAHILVHEPFRDVDDLVQTIFEGYQPVNRN